MNEQEAREAVEAAFIRDVVAMCGDDTTYQARRFAALDAYRDAVRGEATVYDAAYVDNRERDWHAALDAAEARIAALEAALESIRVNTTDVGAALVATDALTPDTTPGRTCPVGVARCPDHDAPQDDGYVRTEFKPVVGHVGLNTNASTASHITEVPQQKDGDVADGKVEGA